MGTPIDEIEYGNDCLICTGLFPAGKTPKYIYIVFEGIEKCEGAFHDPPNGQKFVLEQHPLDHCTWYNSSHPSIYIIVSFTELWTLVEANFLDPPDEFFNSLETASPCVKESISNATDCEGWSYFNGTAKLFWEADGIPYQIAVTMGFTNQSEVLSDRLECGIDHEVIKLCRRCDKTNCLFLVDLEDF